MANRYQGDFGTSFVYQRSVSSLLWGGSMRHCYCDRIFNCHHDRYSLGIIAAVKQKIIGLIEFYK